MRFLFASVLIAGLFIFSAITLGHGTESHAEEIQKVDQLPAESPEVTTSSDDQSVEAQQPRMDEHPEDVDELTHENNDAQPLVENPAMPQKAGPVSRLSEAIED